jgi:hypothetical protein
MTKLLYAILAVLILGSSCRKSKDAAPRENISGTWLMSKKLIGDGGNKPVDLVGFPLLKVKFNSDGSFSSNAQGYKDYNRYELLNDSYLVLLNSATGGSRNIYYSFAPKELFMSFNECREPCGEYFVPVD